MCRDLTCNDYYTEGEKSEFSTTLMSPNKTSNASKPESQFKNEIDGIKEDGSRSFKDGTCTESSVVAPSSSNERTSSTTYQHRPIKKRSDVFHSESSNKFEEYLFKPSLIKDDADKQNHTAETKLIPNVAKSQSEAFKEIRMERKRKREMERRSSVNKELDKLADLIHKIKPPELAGSNTKFQDGSAPSLNRLDLIHIAVKVLNRLYDRTQKDSERINQLTSELNSFKEVLNENNKVCRMFLVPIYFSIAVF